MKILYGLASEGMGHAIRSKGVLSRLANNHDLMIVCGGAPYRVLSQQFDNVHEIVATCMAYKDNTLDFLGTIAQNVKRWPKAVPTNAKILWKIFSEFDADLVITDFESLSSFYADILGKPLISIDNMQIIERCKVDYPKDEKFNYHFTRKLVHDRVPRADHYVITSFFQTEIRKKYQGKVRIVPPILRETVLATRRSLGNHILVYQTSDSSADLPEILKGSAESFIIYGFNEDKEEGNVRFRTFDEATFIEDLASSKAVIVNGGFTTISEAVYLHKPILAVPIRKHFEQILNAFYVQKMGYGEYAERISEYVLASFLDKLDRYKKHLNNYSQDDNAVLFATLEAKIEELTKKIY